jgi:hypothetical protein
MGMMQQTIGWKLEELDRILNDPTTAMEPHRVWSLLDDVLAGNSVEEPCCQEFSDIASGAD